MFEKPNKGLQNVSLITENILDERAKSIIWKTNTIADVRCSNCLPVIYPDEVDFYQYKTSPPLSLRGRDPYRFLFVGLLIPLFWTSGDVSSGFQSQSGFCLIHTWRRRTSNITHSLRFTSGATPADLLVASMAAELISSTYLQRHWWESNGRPLAPWANAQPTELCRLGFLNVSF